MSKKNTVTPLGCLWEFVLPIVADEKGCRWVAVFFLDMVNLECQLRCRSWLENFLLGRMIPRSRECMVCIGTGYTGRKFGDFLGLSKLERCVRWLLERQHWPEFLVEVWFKKLNFARMWSRIIARGS